jgi:hypothetical protein
MRLKEAKASPLLSPPAETDSCRMTERDRDAMERRLKGFRKSG